MATLFDTGANPLLDTWGGVLLDTLRLSPANTPTSVAGQLVSPNATYPGLPAQTSIQQIIPAYVYQQYADDDNIQAFTIAQNQIATEYLLWFNTLNLPIYTGGVVSGALLDWVAQGIYGQIRPSITTGSVRRVGAINTYPINSVPTNGQKIASNLTLQSVSDDIFRRVLTWNLYKGDGFIFGLEWLKRRVKRFVDGANGIPPSQIDLSNISVVVNDGVFSIIVGSDPLPGSYLQALGLDITTNGEPITTNLRYSDTSVCNLLNSLIQSGACITPFQYTFTVSVVSLQGFGLYSDGGVVCLIQARGAYPGSPVGRPVGGLYSNGGPVAIAGPTTPNPSAAPVYFDSVTAATLFVIGGANLPLSNPGAGTGQLWNNGDEVSVA